MLAAASDPYAHLVGEIALERGEGLAWWAAEHRASLDSRRAPRRPACEVRSRARGGALQSLVSVPIVGKDRNVIRVISSHTEAPREFTEAEVEVLVSSASLVAGAIENARLYPRRCDAASTSSST